MTQDYGHAHDTTCSVKAIVTTDRVVSDARTAILRTVFALMPADVSPERWRDVGDVVDDQLHVAWAAGYHARAYEEETTAGILAPEVPAIPGGVTAPVPATTTLITETSAAA